MAAPILFLIDYQRGYLDDAPELTSVVARAGAFTRALRAATDDLLVVAFRFRNEAGSN